MTAQPTAYPVFRHRDDETGTPTSVYRLFDYADRLLYIGVAEDVVHRVYMHMATSTLADADLIHIGYARHESTVYPHRQAAREAERKAIHAEAPLLNRQHNPKRWRRVAGQYQPVDVASYAALRDEYRARWDADHEMDMDLIVGDATVAEFLAGLARTEAKDLASP